MTTATTAATTTPTTTTTTTTPTAATTSTRYHEPGWMTRNVFNRAMRRLVRMGVSVRGSRELRVQGRVSGEWRTVPVNLLTVDGVHYLVAPRGTTQWVRNLRAAGGGELRLGRTIEAFRAIELPDAEKPELLREYLRRWKAEVGVFFDGVGPDAPADELAQIAPGYPVFRVDLASAGRAR